MKHTLTMLLLAGFLGVAAGACGVEGTEEFDDEEKVALAEQELVSTSPVYFDDCAGPATDCCNPLCKPMITACCYANSCGLPASSIVYGQRVWAGLQHVCGGGYSAALGHEETPAD